jgi:hypothetical protein
MKRVEVTADKITQGRASLFVIITKYYYSVQIKDNEMVDACRMYGREINVYNILVGKLEEIRRLGKCRYEWKDNIKMDLKE